MHRSFSVGKPNASSPCPTIGQLVAYANSARQEAPPDLAIKKHLRSCMMCHFHLERLEELLSAFSQAFGEQAVTPSALIFAQSSRWRHLYRRCHSLGDIVLGLVGLVLALPVMVLTAIAIKLESQGPIFHTQERVGFRNQVFQIIKFRSMYVDAEGDGPRWAEERDRRVTRVGRVIRQLRIDELPQLVNVVRGEMSFIGPRPERPVFVEQLERVIPYYSQRHLVKPGLTGWAQVHHPHCASIKDAIEKLQFDFYYIENQSLALDTAILLETYGAPIKDAIEKLKFDFYYIKNQSLALDTAILLETARIVLFGRLARWQVNGREHER